MSVWVLSRFPPKSKHMQFGGSINWSKLSTGVSLCVSPLTGWPVLGVPRPLPYGSWARLQPPGPPECRRMDGCEYFSCVSENDYFTTWENKKQKPPQNAVFCLHRVSVVTNYDLTGLAAIRGHENKNYYQHDHNYVFCHYWAAQTERNAT